MTVNSLDTLCGIFHTVEIAKSGRDFETEVNVSAAAGALLNISLLLESRQLR